MPKKSSKTETEQVTLSAPVVESAAPVAEKKTKAPRAPKTPKAEAAQTPVAAPEPTVEVAAAESEAPLAEQSVEFLAKLQQLSVAITALKTEYRNLERKWSREMKAAQKVSSK
ncbi:MAG: hypothetical protein ACOVRN_02910, partial [Flavobacterium sp.]